MTTVQEAQRLAALELEAKRLGIPLWQLEAARAVPDSLVRDIVADSRRSNSLSSPAAKTREEQWADREEDQGPIDRSGWQKPVPLRSPDGIAQIDRLCDAQDQIDKQSLREKLSRVGKDDR